MTSSELLMEGVELMMLGVGTVFFFLVMLVGLINLMSFVINRFFPEAASVATAPKRMAAVAAQPVDSELLAAIGAAVSQHRARRT
ncbi:MAG: OadG family protein [Pseudomonas sp.]